MVLEKILASPLDYKEIQPVHPKGDQSWVFTARTDVEAETPILWPPDAKSWLIWKDLDAGQDWRREEKGTTKDEMVGWHHWLNGHGLEQPLRDSEGQGSLACCIPWGSKELDMTEQLNWTDSNIGRWLSSWKSKVDNYLCWLNNIIIIVITSIILIVMLEYAHCN